LGLYLIGGLKRLPNLPSHSAGPELNGNFGCTTFVLIYICNFFFFFDMSTQDGEREIRTSDLRFMRHGPQSIELSHEDPTTTL
jgi:hypothetical protein